MLGTVDRALARWRQSGRAIGMSDSELDEFTDAFEHR